MNSELEGKGLPGLAWSGRTDRGPVRPNNEDSFLGVRFDAREVQHLGSVGDGETGRFDYVFAVSDGMGGAKAGEHASRIAVQKITALLPKSYQQSAAGLDAGFADVLEELYSGVHADLVGMGRYYEECSGMEATLSLCWFTPKWVYFAHVGDSRIYLLPGAGGPIRQLSHDDTYVGWLFRNGKINEREARNHPRRNVLQKALGGGNQFVNPQVGAVGVEPGDTYLLCSDGLFEGLYNHQMEELLRTPIDGTSEPAQSLASRLVDESLARYGKDNTTAVVVRVGTS